jgi:hypothetical protein
VSDDDNDDGGGGGRHDSDNRNSKGGGGSHSPGEVVAVVGRGRTHAVAAQTVPRVSSSSVTMTVTMAVWMVVVRIVRLLANPWVAQVVRLATQFPTEHTVDGKL